MFTCESFIFARNKNAKTTETRYFNKYDVMVYITRSMEGNFP